MSALGAGQTVSMQVPEAVAKVISLLKSSDAAQAGRLCEAILKVAPDHVQTLCMHALASAELGRQEDAVLSYRRALKLQPKIPMAHSNLGVALRQLGRHGEAVASFRRALALEPDNAATHSNLGIALKELGRQDQAIASYRRALQLDPTLAEAHLNLGNAYKAQGNQEEARACYERAVQASPGHAGAHHSLGLALLELGRREEAAASLRRSLELDPKAPEVHYDLGVTLGQLRHYAEAAESYRRALGLRPDYVEALTNLGTALRMLGRQGEAAACYGRAAELNPDDRNALYNLGNILRELKRHQEAIAAFERILERSPADGNAFMLRAIEKRAVCDWKDLAQLTSNLETRVESGTDAFPPFPFLAFSDDPAMQLLCAEHFASDRIGEVAALPPAPARDPDAPVRVAYLSADFHEHATAYLMVELFERHDRERFEIHAISFGPVTGDAMQERLKAAFDGFHEVHEQSDREAAELIRGLGTDIAVDLKGYTQDARPAILAYRPAPVQINYLGYPGTMGVGFMDYVLVDRFVVPPDQQSHFTERLYYLPDCYQVNDSTRKIAPETPSREACGLPAEGFVFCCFNQNYKITPPVFDVWMRLLREIPGSVLWLINDYDATARNLQREAEHRGVDAERLVFAPRMPLADHLARQKHADLFVDTFPYNAHTTASDALWAGVPVVTCAGRSFPSRVAGSLLHTIGLPGLVTHDFAAYEALALALATDPARLAGIRRELARNRETSPLFDGVRFARNLEAAFLEMLEEAPRV